MYVFCRVIAVVELLMLTRKTLFLKTKSYLYLYFLFSDLMADPQSPIGTAFGFSRPKRQAAKIANTSLMLEFASSRIVRSFIQGFVII